MNEPKRTALPLLFCALFLSHAACGGESPAAPKPARLGQPFELASGETALVGGADLRVTFNSVKEDSRCPSGAACIWEGDGVARISVVQDAREGSSIELHTNARFSTNDTYGSYRITLVDLAPYPKVNQTIDAKSYVARLEVEAETRTP